MCFVCGVHWEFKKAQGVFWFLENLWSNQRIWPKASFLWNSLVYWLQGVGWLPLYIFEQFYVLGLEIQFYLGCWDIERILYRKERDVSLVSNALFIDRTRYLIGCLSAAIQFCWYGINTLVYNTEALNWRTYLTQWTIGISHKSVWGMRVENSSVWATVFSVLIIQAKTMAISFQALLLWGYTTARITAQARWGRVLASSSHWPNSKCSKNSGAPKQWKQDVHAKSFNPVSTRSKVDSQLTNSRKSKL